MTTTVKLQAITSGMLKVGVLATLAIGSLGITGSAEARVPDGDMEGKAVQCRVIQDYHDDALRLYLAEENWDKKMKYRDHVDYAVYRWHAEGCGDAYGSIRGAPAFNPGVMGSTDGLEAERPLKSPAGTSGIAGVMEVEPTRKSDATPHVGKGGDYSSRKLR